MVEKIKKNKFGFMFPIIIRIYKETSTGIVRSTDKARKISKLNGCEFLELWKNAIKLPVPDPELWTEHGKIRYLDAYVSKNGEWKFGKLVINDEVKENLIDKDIKNLSLVLEKELSKNTMDESKIKEFEESIASETSKDKSNQVKVDELEKSIIIEKRKDKSDKNKIKQLNMIIEGLRVERKKVEISLTTIPQDIRHWQNLQARADREKFSKEGWLKKYGGFVAVIVTAIGCVMLMFVFLKYGFIPMLEEATRVASQLPTMKVQIIGDAASSYSGSLVPPV